MRWLIVIIFLGTFDIILIVFLFFALLVGAVDFINKIITFLFIIFVIKNIIQDVVIGYFKNHNKLISTLWYLIVDTLRIGMYFFVLKEYSIAYSNAGGLAFFGAMFNFILFFVLGGILYLMGEVISLSHSFKKDLIAEFPKGFHITGDILSLVLLAAFCWWAM